MPLAGLWCPLCLCEWPELLFGLQSKGSGEAGNEEMGCEGEQCWGHTLCSENCLQLSWRSQLLQTAGLLCLCHHKALDTSLSTKGALSCVNLGPYVREFVCAVQVPLARRAPCV